MDFPVTEVIVRETEAVGAFTRGEEELGLRERERERTILVITDAPNMIQSI